MPKIYCIRIRPDKYGEGVVPEMEEPNRRVHDELMSMKAKHIVEVLWNATIGKWTDHLASLPVLYLIHPDLAKVGWVGEHREQYEAMDELGNWHPITKGNYFITVPSRRRIVLVPVEGKEMKVAVVGHNAAYSKALHDAMFIAPKQPADKAEEKEVVSDKLEINEYEYVSSIIERGIEAWEQQGYDVNPEGLVDILIYIRDAIKPKPTPVTGEAGEILQDIQNRFGRLLIEGNCDYWPNLRASIISFAKLQAASRTSDAVEVLEWLLNVNLNGVGGVQFHKIIMNDGDFYWETDDDGDQPLDGKDLYKIFKQQPTKP